MARNTRSRSTAPKEEAVEATEGTDEAAIGTATAAVDTTNNSPAVKFHSPPAETTPQVGSTVSGAGIPAGATVLADPEPDLEGFTISAPCTATAANVTATFGKAGAPEQTGALIDNFEDAQAAGYFGKRQNTHADEEYTLPGLVDGASPGDWDNAYDAPGGVDVHQAAGGEG